MASTKTPHNTIVSPLDSELLFLITKYLESGPCKLSARVLKQELVKKQILPRRLDWEGDEHEQSFHDLEKKYPHILPKHLLEICRRVGPLLDKEIKPNVSGLNTLLGAGRQSLLRTAKDVEKICMNIVDYSVRLNQRALHPPLTCAQHNLVKVLHGRENAGPMPRSFSVSNAMYSRMQLLCSTLGHLSAVYCLLFDRTGKYIITGADDLLVKVWSAVDGRLLATLRGAAAEISDIAIDTANTLLAASSIDRLIRVWCLRTTAPVAILTAHTGMITGVNFSPGHHCLASTSSDGSIAIWFYNTTNNTTTFNPKPTQFVERTRPVSAQMISAAFSSGGEFLAAGSADHWVRVYKVTTLSGPSRVMEIEAHTDRVDSIQWANHGLRFVSGSKDGTALIWRYSRQQWVYTKLLMTTQLPGKSSPVGNDGGGGGAVEGGVVGSMSKVTMVSWDCRDQWVVTACGDRTLKVWDSTSGQLKQVLTGHTDEVFVLEGHPLDSQIFMSAGHDGFLLLWNVESGKMIASFQNNIENQGHGAIFDAKWSPDGTLLAATDSHGQILLLGLGSKPPRMMQLPKELFFHTDYRPLVRDASHAVLDEQTNIAPHLMPPPFLVDVEGNPYPPAQQRLVPGREYCTVEQLVPNIILNQEGQQEVVQEFVEPRSNIDQMIQALAGQSRERRPFLNLTSPRSRGARREGDVEGVRQSRGNWQRDEIEWTRRGLVQPLDAASLQTAMKRIEYLGELELADYERESLKPKEEAPPAPVLRPAEKRQRKRQTHNYRTRAVREQQLQDQFEDPNNLDLSGSEAKEDSSDDSMACSDNLDSGSTSSSESASSEYSDWIRDEGEVLEPPKRRSKRIQRGPPKPSRRNYDQKAIPESYRPSDWLSAVVPKKFPYYPQMGDEVVFFKSGYNKYLDAVRVRNIYQTAPAQCNPWGKLNIKESQLVKVVGIRYEVRPPTLCCLRLAIIRPEGRLTRECFVIKHHDIPDVIDFFVLKQTHDSALERTWNEGDRFRSMIDDHWWWGKVIGIGSQESHFLRYSIIWDNGEREFMSPWDMEPLKPDAEPVEPGGSVPAKGEEVGLSQYRPQPDEWPLGDRDAACDRCIIGLDQVMELSFAEPFLVPVDLNRYPTYATIVEYPIDLSMIRARFENRFYRRITAAQFDIRYLATNAEKFNEPRSHIIKQARIITEICLKIVKDTCTVDVSSLYNHLKENYNSSEESEDEDNRRGRRVKADAARSLRASRREASRRRPAEGPFDWRRQCRDLLQTLWDNKDAGPFREPMDRVEHQDYYRMVDTPMDLGTMREELRGGNYESPQDFADDLDRVFSNHKKYISDKRSREFAMNVRLSILADKYMQNILRTFNKKNKNQGKMRRGRRKNHLTDEDNASVSEYEPTTVKRVPKRKRRSSDDEDLSSCKTRTTRRKRRGRRKQFSSDGRGYENDVNLPSTSRVSQTIHLSQKEEDSGSESDKEYQPNVAAVNGLMNKRKSLPPFYKVVKVNGMHSNMSDDISKEKINELNCDDLSLLERLNSEPSTSSTFKPTAVIRKTAKMIHAVKSPSDLSGDSSDDIKSVPRLNSNNRPLESEPEDNYVDDKEVVCNGIKQEEYGKEIKVETKVVQEEVDMAFVDQVVNEEVVNCVDETKYESEEDEESEEDNDSDLDFDPSSHDERPVRKTVKCIYPKRRVLETDSENSKENVLNGRRSGMRNSNGRLTNTRNGLLPQQKQGKYPLRQTAKKNLAENSTDGSEVEESAPYKTRGMNQKAVNGLSLYTECNSSDEEDVDVEEQSEDSNDDDSEVYQPKTSGQQKKRTRSSDSAASRSLRGRKVQRAKRQADSDISSDEGPYIDRSSRGRVRKLSRRVRALLRD